jgi:hypothetical protein
MPGNDRLLIFLFQTVDPKIEMPAGCQLPAFTTRLLKLSYELRSFLLNSPAHFFGSRSAGCAKEILQVDKNPIRMIRGKIFLRVAVIRRNKLRKNPFDFHPTYFLFRKLLTGTFIVYLQPACRRGRLDFL